MRKVLMLLVCGAVTACGSGRSQNASNTQPPQTAALSENAVGEPNAPNAQAEKSKPELGRCHQDSCSWSLAKGRTVVKKDATGILVRLSLLGGTSENTDGDAEKAHIRWNTKEHEVYVFCSKRLPAVIMKTDLPPGAAKASGGYHFPPYQVDVLDFVNGVPGGYESSANLFVSTCYPNDDWTTPGFAKRNGLPAFDELPDVTIDNPEGIFQAADRMPGY